LNKDTQQEEKEQEQQPWASYLHSWCSGQLSLPSLRGR